MKIFIYMIFDIKIESSIV